MAATPSPTEVVERERRFALPAALATFASVVLILAGVFLSPLNFHNNRTLLLSADAHSGQTILFGVVGGIGFLLLLVPLLFLFRATQARNPGTRSQFVVFTLLGPVLFAIQSIVAVIVITHLGSDFASGSVTTGKAGVHAAKHMVDDSGGQQTAKGLRLSAALALLVGVIYTSRQAMRVGLLSRFIGTFGMALGASIVFIPFGTVLLLIWIFYLGLLFAGWVGRPPAWAVGEAIPWPTPGERMAEQMKGEDGEELEEEPEGEPAAESGAEDAAPDLDAPEEESAFHRPRKRKRRSGSDT